MTTHDTDRNIIYLGFDIGGEDKHRLDDSELIQALLDGLPCEWFDPDDGDPWYVKSILHYTRHIDGLKASNRMFRKLRESDQTTIADFKHDVDTLIARVEHFETLVSARDEQISRLEGMLHDARREIEVRDETISRMAADRPADATNRADAFATYLDREAARYADLLNALNDGVPVPNGKWILDQTGGGMTHAAWYGTADKPAWVAIDDNDQYITIGAYVGDEVNEMVYDETLYTDSAVENLTSDEAAQILVYTDQALHAVLAYYYTEGARP